MVGVTSSEGFLVRELLYVDVTDVMSCAVWN